MSTFGLSFVGRFVLFRSVPLSEVSLYFPGGAPQGGQGGGRPPQLEHWGGIAPPNFGLQYKGVPKSPLLSLFCNSVYWLKPHNNVNSRPPNLAVLPPPLLSLPDQVKESAPYQVPVTPACTPEEVGYRCWSCQC